MCSLWSSVAATTSASRRQQQQQQATRLFQAPFWLLVTSVGGSAAVLWTYVLFWSSVAATATSPPFLGDVAFPRVDAMLVDAHHVEGPRAVHLTKRAGGATANS